MGFQVYVEEVVQFSVRCNESGCKYEGNIFGSRSEAERIMRNHYVQHQEDWAALNRHWDGQPSPQVDVEKLMSEIRDVIEDQRASAEYGYAGEVHDYFDQSACADNVMEVIKRYFRIPEEPEPDLPPPAPEPQPQKRPTKAVGIIHRV